MNQGSESGNPLEMDIQPMPKRKFRDSVFASLFSEKKYLLQLYQALHPEEKGVT